jgi:DNA-binding transcriptional LysR family regulator
MPELRHLRLFLAVAQERNFTRAAEKLHMAQQAVS